MSMNRMKTLALDDLDIEELERRIELAQAGAAPTMWGCDDCPVDCPSVCDQFYICGTNVFK
jgi:hypothetical protein